MWGANFGLASYSDRPFTTSARAPDWPVPEKQSKVVQTAVEEMENPAGDGSPRRILLSRLEIAFSMAELVLRKLILADVNRKEAQGLTSVPSWPTTDCCIGDRPMVRHTVQHSRQGIIAAEDRSDSLQGTGPEAQAISRCRNLTLVCRYVRGEAMLRAG